MDPREMQHRIRANALQQSEFMEDMASWEKAMKTKQKKKQAPLPPVRQRAKPCDSEAAQRDLGNQAFAAGDYAAAITSYTLCLGLKKHNVVAFANRAMAYLKLQEFHNAEADCTAALGIDKDHVKALHRRALARDALGKHRAALWDLEAALKLQPQNKVLINDKRKVKAHLRACVATAPLVRISM